MTTDPGAILTSLDELKVRGEIALADTREIIRNMKEHASEIRRDAVIMVSYEKRRR